MIWFLPAILSPAFAAIVNHIDKHLLSRYFKDREVGSLVLFSSFVSLPLLLLLIIFGVPIWSIGATDMLILIVCGLLYMGGTVPYFYALSSDEASVVAPLFQLISPITALLGVFFLGEQLSTGGVFGGGLIFVGALILSMQIEEARFFRIKKRIFLLMLLSSVFFATNGLFFKLVSMQASSFWVSAFWEYTGVFIFGLTLYVFMSRYRKQFQKMMKKNSASLLTLNSVNEIFAVASQLLINYAVVLGPLAIVYWVVDGFQPLFVFLFGIVLSLFFPFLTQESLLRKHLVQKIFALAIMLIGTYLLYSS